MMLKNFIQCYFRSRDENELYLEGVVGVQYPFPLPYNPHLPKNHTIHQCFTFYIDFLLRQIPVMLLNMCNEAKRK